MASMFAVPLQGAQANVEEVVKELREIILYATQYVALAVLENST